MTPEQLASAGFSPAEIGEYQNLQGAGFGDAEIAAYYDAQKEPPQRFATPPSGPTQLRQGKPIREAASRLYTPVLKGLGAVGGGLLAAPASALSAPTGVGPLLAEAAGIAGGYAAGGQAAQALNKFTGLDTAPVSAGSALRDMGGNLKEGAEAGALAVAPGAVPLVGRVAGKASQGSANFFTRAAFKFPTKLTQLERARLVSTAQRYGLAPGSVDELLAVKGSLLEKQSALEQHALLNDITTGRSVAAADIAKALNRVAADTAKSDLPVSAKRVVLNYAKRFLKENPERMTTLEAIKKGRDLQAQLQAIYNASENVAPTVKLTWETESKSAIEQAFRRYKNEAVPGYAEVNAELSSILKLEPHITQTGNRVQNANPARVTDMAGAVLGGVPGAVASRVGNTPNMWARAGNTLSRGPKGEPAFDMASFLAYRAPTGTGPKMLTAPAVRVADDGVTVLPSSGVPKEMSAAPQQRGPAFWQDNPPPSPVANPEYVPPPERFHPPTAADSVGPRAAGYAGEAFTPAQREAVGIPLEEPARAALAAQNRRAIPAQSAVDRLGQFSGGTNPTAAMYGVTDEAYLSAMKGAPSKTRAIVEKVAVKSQGGAVPVNLDPTEKAAIKAIEAWLKKNRKGGN